MFVTSVTPLLSTSATVLVMMKGIALFSLSVVVAMSTCRKCQLGRIVATNIYTLNMLEVLAEGTRLCTVQYSRAETAENST